MRKRPKTFLSILILLVISAITVIAALHEQDQGGSNSPDKEVATPIRQGVMTEKQRAHSKLHEQRYGSGRKLIDLTKATGDVDIIASPPMPFFDPNSPTPTAFQVLRGLSCEADAVITGTVKSKAAQLTEAEDFVFTDYEITVGEIFKDNIAAHIELNSDITLTRPGGAVRLNGRTVRAKVGSFQPFEVGERYLIFLKYIPVTGGYLAANSKGSFLLRGNKAIKLTEERLIDGLENNTGGPLLADVRTALAAGCDANAFSTFLLRAL